MVFKKWKDEYQAAENAGELDFRAMRKSNLKMALFSFILSGADPSVGGYFFGAVGVLLTLSAAQLHLKHRTAKQFEKAVLNRDEDISESVRQLFALVREGKGEAVSFDHAYATAKRDEDAAEYVPIELAEQEWYRDPIQQAHLRL